MSKSASELDHAFEERRKKPKPESVTIPASRKKMTEYKARNDAAQPMPGKRSGRIGVNHLRIRRNSRPLSMELIFSSFGIGDRGS
jgi:hypothetical protein